jgi:hypothetical protein
LCTQFLSGAPFGAPCEHAPNGAFFGAEGDFEKYAGEFFFASQPPCIILAAPSFQLLHLVFSHKNQSTQSQKNQNLLKKNSPNDRTIITTKKNNIKKQTNKQVNNNHDN